MAGVAVDVHTVVFVLGSIAEIAMAIDAETHVERFNLGDDLHAGNVTVAGGTGRFDVLSLLMERLDVWCVRKAYVVGQIMDTHPFEGLFIVVVFLQLFDTRFAIADGDMAVHAGVHARHTGLLADLDAGMAIAAVDAVLVTAIERFFARVTGVDVVPVRNGLLGGISHPSRGSPNQPGRKRDEGKGCPVFECIENSWIHPD